MKTAVRLTLVSGCLITFVACISPLQPADTRTTSPIVREDVAPAQTPPEVTVMPEFTPKFIPDVLFAPPLSPESPPAVPEPVVELATETTPLPPPPDIYSFRNRASIDVAMVFGEANFIRHDPPAELWQYRTSICTLDLFFYDDGTGAYRLEYIDFRGQAETPGARDDCLRGIIGSTLQ